MPDDVLIELLRKMLWVSVLLSAPVLLATMVIGLIIGILQAVTSIQEQTLSFVPKLAAIGLVLVLLGSWMTRVLVDYSAELFTGLPQIGAL
ncbi:flagellar biosynthetic protein FliQ [Planctomycetota bacterium]|nr:flagellar biosynthetic protein FliQ [Planctomycetota bacterium]